MRQRSWLGVLLPIVGVAYCSAAFGADSASREPPKEEIVVSSVTELRRAVSEVRPGQAILLRHATYRAFSIKNVQFDGPVTIRSADPARPARLEGLTIENATNLEFEGLVFASGLVEDAPYRSIVTVRKSRAIAIRASEFHGTVDGNFRNDPIGVRFRSTDGVEFSRNRLHDLARGLMLAGVRHARISGNRFHDMRSDGANFAGVQNVVIEGNFFTRFHPEPGDHPDFIQFWQRNALIKDTEHVVIRKNVMLQGSTHPVQAIFIGNRIRGRQYRHFVIEDNLIYVSSPHGISLYDGVNARVANNTLVAYPSGPFLPRINLFRTQRAEVLANIAPALRRKEATRVAFRRNIVTATSVPGTGHHPTNLFVDPDAGPSAEISSFRPRPGSYLDLSAADRIGIRWFKDR